MCELAKILFVAPRYYSTADNNTVLHLQFTTKYQMLNKIE